MNMAKFGVPVLILLLVALASTDQPIAATPPQAVVSMGYSSTPHDGPGSITFSVGDSGMIAIRGDFSCAGQGEDGLKGWYANTPEEALVAVKLMYGHISPQEFVGEMVRIEPNWYDIATAFAKSCYMAGAVSA